MPDFLNVCLRLLLDDYYKRLHHLKVNKRGSESISIELLLMKRFVTAGIS